MKILHTEASLGWGGQEIRTLRESIGMRERGHTVMIAAHPDSQLLLHSAGEGFKTIPFAFKRRGLLRAVLFFKKLIEENNIDIVNTHSSKDSWLVLPSARLAKNRPLTLRTRHLSTPVGKNILSRFLYNVLPHMLITTGTAIRDQLVNINGFDPEKIVSIPTGADITAFNPEEKHNDIRSELNITPDTPLIGTLSVLRSWKGSDYFVRSIPLILEKFPEARFIIAGEGPYRAVLEKTISNTNVKGRLYLLGHREDVADVLHSLDILVHPSYANEGVPQTILQALAMRKPVVASDLTPLKEIITNNETGLLSGIKDPASIAACVIKFLENRNLADKLAVKGRELVLKSYSYTGMLDRLESLYLKTKRR